MTKDEIDKVLKEMDAQHLEWVASMNAEYERKVKEADRKFLIRSAVVLGVYVAATLANVWVVFQ